MTELQLSLGLAAVAGLALLGLRRATSPRGKTARRDWFSWLFFGLFAAALLFWRAPCLRFDRELNPDESQMLAQTMRYRHNPIPWHSVDGTTSGPLNTYILMWPLAVGIQPTYFTARLTGLACILLTVLFSAKTFGRIAGARTAFIGVLPLMLCYLFASDRDLVHYSSELLPACLLSAAVWLMTFSFERPGDGKVFLAGVVLGSVPFAKLQAGPAAVYIFLGFCAVLLFRNAAPGLPPSGSEPRPSTLTLKCLGLLSFGSFVVPGLILIPVTLAGAFDEFLSRYLISGATYASVTDVSPLTSMGKFLGTDSLRDYFLGLAAGWSIALALVFRSTRHARSSWAPGFFFALGYLLCSIFVVSWTGFGFLHYALLLVPPATHLTAWICKATGSLPPARSAFRDLSRLKTAAAPLVCTIVQLAGFAGGTGNYGQRPLAMQRRDQEAAVIRLITACSASGRESLAVWGWTPSYYVRTGLRPATRDSIGQYLLCNNPRTDHYRERFLRDLKRDPPRVFVDSADEFEWIHWGPSAERRYTMYPPLAEFVKHHYDLAAALVTHVGGLPVLVYVRKETPPSSFATQWPPALPSKNQHPIN